MESYEKESAKLREMLPDPADTVEVKQGEGTQFKINISTCNLIF